MEQEQLEREIFFNNLRKEEYTRLDRSGHVYLDFTGGNLYPESLLLQHFSQLQQSVYGNPHSTNPASQLSEKLVNEARKNVLQFFNARDYYCVFTSNASEALHIIGECYPFSPESHLLLTTDNHNSVNGIREYCRNKGGYFTYSPMNTEDLTINATELKKHLQAHADKKDKLFAFPAQSNVSGAQHSLSWIEKARANNWDVLLDAAAFVPTSRLDLSIHRPDFVSLSFYKIFGYPTGIGCLLIHKSKLDKLKKPSFAGGTISLSAVKYSSYFLKPDHEKFENGTVNYLDIPAITNGLDFITRIGMGKINSRIKDLCHFILPELQALQHNNGRPLIKLYGPGDTENRGGTFLLNFFDAKGQQYPFQHIEELANARMISFRTGCFCNPGIDELNHCISIEQLKKYFSSRQQGDYYDFVHFTGKLRGAVRISIGLATTREDLKKFIEFTNSFLNKLVPGAMLKTSASMQESSVV
jgi:molybdenum cofactor sulfurtransferase